MTEKVRTKGYWEIVWGQFLKYKMGVISLVLVFLFFLVGLYAPLLASSKPLVVVYDHKFYFPLFRYLFYGGFYTKRVDIFFNLLMFFFPIVVIVWFTAWCQSKAFWGIWCGSLLVLFAYFGFLHQKDPAVDLSLVEARYQVAKEEKKAQSWDFELQYSTDYEKLNRIIKNKVSAQIRTQMNRKYGEAYAQKARAQWIDDHLRNILRRDPKAFVEEVKANLIKEANQKKFPLPTVHSRKEWLKQLKIQTLSKEQARLYPDYVQALLNLQEKDRLTVIEHYTYVSDSLAYLLQRERWFKEQDKKISVFVMPLLSPYHWQDDAGSTQSINTMLDWWEVKRSNGKDLIASVLFGVRVSMMVGILAVGISLVIGIPLGVLAGYYAGKLDIILSRLIEVWEALPVFFMLLFVVAITQSKSIFLVISVLGIFGWTGFARYARGEVFKQRNLSYVMACRSLGFDDLKIMFSHILPNAIPPILTLIPFSIMAAITSEAGLSFLGLGEEGSASWGVLMDEGRRAFPGESYLLWPPALMLTLFLIAIALVGNALRDAFDPKMHRD